MTDSDADLFDRYRRRLLVVAVLAPGAVLLVAAGIVTIRLDLTRSGSLSWAVGIAPVVLIAFLIIGAFFVRRHGTRAEFEHPRGTHRGVAKLVYFATYAAVFGIGMSLFSDSQDPLIGLWFLPAVAVGQAVQTIVPRLIPVPGRSATVVAVAPLGVDPDEVIAWSGPTRVASLRSAVIALLAVAVISIAVLLVAPGSNLRAVLVVVGSGTLILAILKVFFSALRMEIDTEGITVYGAFDRRIQHIDVSQVTDAAVETEPIPEIGFSLTRPQGNVITHERAALDLTLTSGRHRYITVENPEEAAAVVLALLGGRAAPVART